MPRRKLTTISQLTLDGVTQANGGASDSTREHITETYRPAHSRLVN